MPDPALCTETLDVNLTAGTFRLFLQESGGEEFEVGNIETGGLQYTPNVLEHRRGLDNSLDAVLAIGRDYFINFTTDTITIQNLAFLLNESTANTAEGCKIPLSGSTCVRTYGARLLKAFPCADKLIEITFWRAQILSEFNLNFERESFAQLEGQIRSLNCSSAHPNEPYGQIIELGATCES